MFHALTQARVSKALSVKSRIHKTALSRETTPSPTRPRAVEAALLGLSEKSGVPSLSVMIRKQLLRMNYVITGVLGKGTVGTVFEVRHTQTSALHALKLQIITTKEALTAYKNELDTQTKLNSSELSPTVYATMRVGQIHGFIMSKVCGTLNDALAVENSHAPIKCTEKLGTDSRQLGVLLVKVLVRSVRALTTYNYSTTVELPYKYTAPVRVPCTNNTSTSVE